MLGVLGGLLAGVVVIAVSGVTAEAQGNAPCSASINGMPVLGRTIAVGQKAPATVEVAATPGPAQNYMYLEFFGQRWQIASVESNGGRWTGQVRVEEFARLGVGLYKLVWETRNPRGEVVCAASTAIRVEGFPLGTVAGIAGTLALASGVLALTLTAKATINEGARWAIKVLTKIEAKKEQRKLRLKPKISVSQTLLSTLWGLLLSGGTLAILQETALSLPTIELAVQLVIPLTALSFATSWLRLVRE